MMASLYLHELTPTCNQPFENASGACQVEPWFAFWQDLQCSEAKIHLARPNEPEIQPKYDIKVTIRYLVVQCTCTIPKFSEVIMISYISVLDIVGNQDCRQSGPLTIHSCCK